MEESTTTLRHSVEETVSVTPDVSVAVCVLTDRLAGSMGSVPIISSPAAATDRSTEAWVTCHVRTPNIGEWADHATRRISHPPTVATTMAYARSPATNHITDWPASPWLLALLFAALLLVAGLTLRDSSRTSCGLSLSAKCMSAPILSSDCAAAAAINSAEYSPWDLAATYW